MDISAVLFSKYNSGNVKANIIPNVLAMYKIVVAKTL